MNSYEVLILRDREPPRTLVLHQESDSAAIASAKLLIQAGEDVEVWCGAKCIFRSAG